MLLWYKKFAISLTLFLAFNLSFQGEQLPAKYFSIVSVLL